MKIEIDSPQELADLLGLFRGAPPAPAETSDPLPKNSFVAEGRELDPAASYNFEGEGWVLMEGVSPGADPSKPGYLVMWSLPAIGISGHVRVYRLGPFTQKLEITEVPKGDS